MPKIDHRFIFIYLAGAIAPFTGNLILPMITNLENDFTTNVSLVLLSFTLFQIPYAIGQFFSGGISDVYGRRKLITGGILIMIAGLALTPFSTSIWFFIATRVLQGIGMALAGPVLVALIGDLTDFSNRSKYMGYYGAAINAGIALGPLIGGLMANQWRLLFLALAVFSSSLFVYSLFSLRGIPVKEGGSAGEVVEALRDTLRYRSVLTLGVIGFFTFFSYIAVLSISSNGLSVFPYYLDPNTIGIILSTSGFVGVFVSSLAGILTGRLGKRKIPITGFIIVGCSLIALARVTTYSGPAFPLGYIPNALTIVSQGVSITGENFLNLQFIQTLFGSIYGGIIIQTLFKLIYSGIFINFLVFMMLLVSGISLVWPSLLSLTVDFVPPERRGTSSSIFNGMRFLGYAAAPTVYTPLYLSIGLNAVFITGATFIPPIIALVFLVTRTRKKTEKQKTQKGKKKQKETLKVNQKTK
ncbi:MAG: MFS transporter [Candidatus Freyarchaeum deiterrae]